MKSENFRPLDTFRELTPSPFVDDEAHIHTEAKIVHLHSPKGEKGNVGGRGAKGDRGERGEKGESIRGERGLTGLRGSPDTAEMIAEKVNALEEAIEPTTIRGLVRRFSQLEKTLSLQARTSRNDVYGPGRLAIFNAGTRITDNFQEINFTGATLTYVNSRVTVAANTGALVLVATGTIDDTNLTFTFTALPSVLVVNGAVYQQTGGSITWSWVAGTLTATLSSAVGAGGSIFGLT